MLVIVTPHIDPQNDTVLLVLDLTGNDPFQHEFLREVFAADLSTTEDEKDAVHGVPLGADALRVRLTTTTKGAFARAQHTIENRNRVAIGQPTLEQEAEAAAAKAQALADADAAEAKAKADAEAKAAADRKALASDVADELIARQSK